MHRLGVRACIFIYTYPVPPPTLSGCIALPPTHSPAYWAICNNKNRIYLLIMFSLFPPPQTVPRCRPHTLPPTGRYICIRHNNYTCVISTRFWV